MPILCTNGSRPSIFGHCATCIVRHQRVRHGESTMRDQVGSVFLPAQNEGCGEHLSDETNVPTLFARNHTLYVDVFGSIRL